ncbi:MAG: DNA polymerase III subunit delta' [Rhizomicrobium sp.]|jgi:DNA polymerase-3 subunit delta'
MARRARSEPPEVKDSANAPRETFALIGHEEPLMRASRAIRGGRPPQALLISGAPGLGKATLAYRIARYLLAYGASARGPEDLAVAPNDPASIQVRAGAHPGLIVLKRAVNPDTGKTMTVLGVDEIRRLGGFFGLTSGAGGWRIAIIDTADDMNDAAANALLKILEEPPARAMLLVLSNAPARLLPTIRSRCQRLDLKPLADADVEAELERRLPELSKTERASIVKLVCGSIGAALKLAGDNGMAIATDAERLLDRAASPDFTATLALAEKIARMDDGVDSFGQYLVQALSERIRARARSGGGNLRYWVELSEKLHSSFRRTDGLHLEPRQTILSASRALSDTAKRGAI